MLPFNLGLQKLLFCDYHLLKLPQRRELEAAFARPPGIGAHWHCTTNVKAESTIEAAIDPRLPVVGQAMHAASRHGVKVWR